MACFDWGPKIFSSCEPLANPGSQTDIKRNEIATTNTLFFNKLIIDLIENTSFFI
jgi:hypothetical protein